MNTTTGATMNIEPMSKLVQCEYESPAVRDFDGSGWVSFDCSDAATSVITWTDSTLAGSGFEHNELHVCDVHGEIVFVELDSDAAQLDVKREQLR